MLGALAVACARESVVPPVIIAVTMGETSVVLRLAAPHADPPTPWTALPDARRWMRADGAEIAASEAAGLRSIGPGGLVAVGLSGRPGTLVDLSRARGIIALEGDRAARAEVAHRWIDEYTRAPWSKDRTVGLVGLRQLSTEGTVDLTVRDVVAAIASGSAGLALLAEFPPGEDGADLRRALESLACRWTVVTLGGTGPARWTFTAATDGTVTSEIFPADAAPPLFAEELTR